MRTGYRLSSCPRNTGFASEPATALSMKNNRRSALQKEQDHTNLVDKIVAEYQKNTAVRDIAEKYGVSISYCSAIAVRAGISNKELSHRRITRRQQKRNDEIFEKYQNGIGAKTSLRHTIIPCRVFTVSSSA